MDLFCSDNQGALYSVGLGGTISQKASPANTPSGAVWSANGTQLDWIDTSQQPLRIDKFDYDVDTASITNRRLAVKMSEKGYPDGCAIDNQDRIWVAKWGGWCVECYDPHLGCGEEALIYRYGLPVEQVTACAFGGPDLDQLYVTTASCGLSPQQKKQQPLAGNLFAINLKGIAVGVKSVSFKG